MSKEDLYASESKTQALIQPDTRTEAECKLAKMLTERGADEQGAEAYLILQQIAVDLLAKQSAQRKPLTDEEIDVIWDAVITPSNHIRVFVRAIEAAHNIKEQP